MARMGLACSVCASAPYLAFSCIQFLPERRMGRMLLDHRLPCLQEGEGRKAQIRHAPEGPGPSRGVEGVRIGRLPGRREGIGADDHEHIAPGRRAERVVAPAVVVPCRVAEAIGREVRGILEGLVRRFR